MKLVVSLAFLFLPLWGGCSSDPGGKVDALADTGLADLGDGDWADGNSPADQLEELY